jgi:hypothetical protein
VKFRNGDRGSRPMASTYMASRLHTKSTNGISVAVGKSVRCHTVNSMSPPNV